MRLSPGTRLAAYEILASLGVGGMGEVYRAHDPRLGREVAVKILSPELAADPEALDRFRREARALAALDHPGIVTVHSVEEADGVHFLTMQLVEGQTLDTLIPAGGMPVERILEIATALAEALATAHDKGIVHRDLKPANVMVTRSGRVKVLDFGLAKLTATVDEARSQFPTEALTRAGIVMGTVPYMSPEQVQGRAVDSRDDVFSLGVILYEMATGQRPFRSDSTAGLMSAIMRDDPPAPASLRAGLPETLQQVIQRCLAKDARARFQAAGELLAALAGRPRSDNQVETSAIENRSMEATRSDSGANAGVPWIAVLPFKAQGEDSELAAFAHGLAEDVTTGMSRFSHLQVIAHSSAMQYAERSRDMRAVCRELGARYALEGAVRKAGSAVRVSVQLLDAATGTHMWAETYDRDLAGVGIFQVQDDITDQVVATVADPYGILVRAMALEVRDRPVAELSARELALRCSAYFHQIRPDEHSRMRAALERKLEREPTHAEAWGWLSRLYSHEHEFRLNPLPDSVERARRAAERAVDADPTCQAAWEALAEACYFARDLGAFRNAAERAMALNPRNTSTLAFMGVLISHGGEWDRGVGIARRAMELNRHHAGWYHFPQFFDHYRKREFNEALETATRLNMPDDFWTHAVTAAASGQLGRREEARAALERLGTLLPGYREELGPTLRLWIVDAAFVEQVMEGVAKAEALASSAPPSGAQRREEGFWVAVLPFRHKGASADVAALAEGLTEEIVTGLARFSYLRVISRGSTSRYGDAAVDVRAVGEELGARYVMEGSLRQGGEQLRVAVQLVDASTGAHLWAENYTRLFRPDQAFAVQDDLVPRIVSTCGDHFGVLARAISEAVRGRPLAGITPYEALMRGFGYHLRLSPGEHAEAREALERAVERAPANPDCWAMLSWVYSHEHAHGFNPRPESLGRALTAARRAVDLAPSNHLAQQALAVVLFFRKETAACLSAAEQAIALNPLDGSNEAIFLITFTGDWERGCALVRRAMEWNPHHPRWYELILGLNEYRLGHHRAALDEIVRANLPEGFWKSAILAAVHGQLGESAAASHALRELLAQRDDFARSGRAHFEKWFAPQLVEDLMDGLRKAGLETAT